MTNNTTQLQSSQRLAKYMEERITKIEETFGTLCEALSSINRKNAKLRDKGDSLSNLIIAYADSENVNKTTKSALQSFATSYASIQNYRDAKVKRTDEKVVKPLCDYGKKCQLAKRDIFSDLNSRKREIKEYKQLEKLKLAHPSNPLKINMAEEKLKRAQLNATNSTRLLEKNTEPFEQEKLTDLKKVLMDFVHIEMVFHAKALENLSSCYQSLDAIDEADDLEGFRNTLRDFGDRKLQKDSELLSPMPNDIYSEPHIGTPKHGKETTLTRQYRDQMVANDDDDDDDDEDDELSDYEDDTTSGR